MGESTSLDRVDSWVARTIATSAETVAVQDGARLITYADLGMAADHVRNLVAAAGAVPGGLVGVRMRRGWKMYAAMLGIWRHGSGYVPIDPSYPEDRQAYIVRDAGIPLVIDDDFHLTPMPVERHSAAPPRDIAYVIYTSGSTGRPKGVLLRHASVLAFLNGFIDRFAFGPGEVWAQFCSPCFDVSVSEIWAPLVTGARLVVVPEESTVDSSRLARLLAAERVTILSQVPTVFRYLLQAAEGTEVGFPGLRYVLLAGEPIEPRTVARWRDLGLAPNADIYNLYGPTEGTVYATCQHLTDGLLREPDLPGTPIGTAMPHLRVELRHNGTAVPAGQEGEIHLGGAVAAGYLGAPEQTRTRFLPADDGTVWYRTGDIAVRDDNGNLHFLGRADGQVKLRGMRVELGEIDVHLNACDGVREAAAVMVPSRQGDPIIVACYVPVEQTVEDMPARMRDSLSVFLPEHMIPVRFIALPKLPLTLSGKLDRKRLEGIARQYRNGAIQNV